MISRGGRLIPQARSRWACPRSLWRNYRAAQAFSWASLEGLCQNRRALERAQREPARPLPSLPGAAGSCPCTTAYASRFGSTTLLHRFTLLKLHTLAGPLCWPCCGLSALQHRCPPKLLRAERQVHSALKQLSCPRIEVYERIFEVLCWPGDKQTDAGASKAPLDRTPLIAKQK